MADLPALPKDFDPKSLRCCDCGGWPIDNGSVFVAVFLIRDGVPILSGMCELCQLKRLQHRAHMVNMSSGLMWQIDLPELNIHKRRQTPSGGN